MHTLTRLFALVAVLVCVAGPTVVAVEPVNTSWTYQGQIQRGGVLITDACDLRFRLYDADSGGAQVGPDLTRSGVSVADGRFTVRLDFGINVFLGDRRWLEIDVQCPADGGFTTLAPRQELTATPYALAMPNFHTEILPSGPAAVIGSKPLLGAQVSDPTVAASGTTLPGTTSFWQSFTAVQDAQLAEVRFDGMINPAGQDDAAVTTRVHAGTGINGPMLGEVVDRTDSVAFLSLPPVLVHAGESYTIGLEIDGGDAELELGQSYAGGTNDLGSDYAFQILSSALTAIDPVMIATSEGRVGINTANLNRTFTVTGDASISDNVGIGRPFPLTRLHVADDLLGSSFCSVFSGECDAPGSRDHVALIEHLHDQSLMCVGEPSCTNETANVLALKVNHESSIGPTTNFLTCFNRNDTSVGSIEGGVGGTITLTSGSADYAEYLPVRNENETFAPGDVVGVIGGRITKDTSRAESIAVISTAPIVLGNRPRPTDEPVRHEKVAFLGQTPVNVYGPVHIGDCIIASRRNDGTGIAVAADRLQPEVLSRVVGRAWESSSNPDVKQIRCVIRPPTGAAVTACLVSVLQAQREQITTQRAAIDRLTARLDRLEKRLQDPAYARDDAH